MKNIKKEIASELASEATLALEGVGLEFNPMTPEELQDDGPWTVSEDGHSIASDNFTHDVILRITGDFYDDRQRKAYAENLVKKLNAPKSVLES